MLLSAVLSLLLSTSPLEGNIAFQEGRRLADEFEYEKAIFRFREAARDESLGIDRATALVWLGLTYAKIGEQKAADDAFLEAVRIDPLVALPPSTPPKILEALEAARRKLRDERAAAAATTTAVAPTTTTTTTTVPPTAAATTTTPTTTTTTTTTTEPASAAEPPAVRGPPLLSIGGGALTGLGAVIVGGGAVVGALAARSADDARAATFQDERQRLNDDAAGQALVANVCFGVGAAVIVGGGAALVAGLAGGDQ
jgi:tetratricopeptide (TPR) repeat protein